VVKEELYIGNERVELLGSLEPNLTFNISDIKNPDKRKSDFSKSISLPGSKKINKLFEHIFEVNIDLQTFNPNLKTDVLYLVNGETIIDGYLQLKEIKIIDELISYEVTIIGRVGNFVKDLGDKYIDDSGMLWGDLDHDWTQANQIASWTPTFGTGYVYPIIDYGFNTGLVNWSVVELFPSIFAKEYIDRMFDDSAFTYNSTFFQTAPFLNLIIPYNAKDFKLSDSSINNRLFEGTDATFIGGGTSLNVPTSTSIQLSNYVDSTMSLETDPNGVFDVATGYYTCNEKGTYNFTFEVDLTITYTPLIGGVPPTFDHMFRTLVLAELVLLHKDSLGNRIGGYMGTGAVGIERCYLTLSDTISAGVPTVTSTGLTYPDNDFVDNTSVSNFQLNSNNGTPNFSDVEYYGTTVGYYPLPRNVNQPNTYRVNVQNLQMEAGETINMYIGTNAYPRKFGVDLFNNSSGITFNPPPLGYKNGTSYNNAADLVYGNVNLNITNGSFKNSVVNNNYIEGNTIDMFRAIPKKIKQKDFFMSIVKMFNLYVEPDQDNPSQLNIEPRNAFYNNTINDWTHKLDNSKEVVYLPMGELDSKIYKYTYSEDKDYYNKLYFETWNEVYGEREFEINNDFLTNTHETKIIFAPTPSVGQNYNDKILPTIKKVDSNNLEVRTESKIRILYYKGLIPTIYNWTHISTLVSDIVNSTYPYASHYDDPHSPTVDINFGLTKEIYYDNQYGAITFSNNNLYNAYHRDFIEEITDVNSKIVRGYFNLTPNDISALSFKELYYFNKAYFRLNKIENYNAGNLTMCEFLLLENVNAFTASTATGIGGFDTNMLEENVPLFSNGNFTFKNQNIIPSRNVDVKGYDNYVDFTCENITIIGNNNHIVSNSKNVFIQGNNNGVRGASNVSLVNCESQEVLSSNTTIINNNKESKFIDNGIKTITINELAELDIQTYLCDTSLGNITLQLPDAPIGKVWIVKLIDATNQVTVIPVNVLSTIDGAATLALSALNLVFQIQYDGFNYRIITRT